jgi:catechol 2,3-dioxygenase-like lactoylglutathione lyase family enzyme
MIAKFASICPVFLTNDVMKTTDFYVNKLGFKFAKHFDKTVAFSTVYRDSIEIVIIEKRKGKIESNTEKYGNGEDAYIVIDTVDGVKEIFNELNNNDVKIIKEPTMTDYGSLEFIFEDIDGRNIGVGRILDKELYFKNSNLL